MKKRVISWLVIFSVIFSVFSVCPVISAADEGDSSSDTGDTVKVYRCGDVLGNGTVSISSALEILKYLAKLDTDFDTNPRAMKAATAFTRGESPSINDALEILKYLAKLPSYFGTSDCYCDWCEIEETHVTNDTSDENTESEPPLTTDSATVTTTSQVVPTTASTAATSQVVPTAASTTTTSQVVPTTASVTTTTQIVPTLSTTTTSRSIPTTTTTTSQVTTTTTTPQVTNSTTTTTPQVTNSTTTTTPQDTNSTTTTTPQVTTTTTTPQDTNSTATTTSQDTTATTTPQVTTTTTTPQVTTTTTTTRVTTTTTTTTRVTTTTTTRVTTTTTTTTPTITYDVVRYTITLNLNGGSLPSGTATTYQTSSGSAPGVLTTALPTPTRNGYTFDGWYTAMTGGTKVVSGTSSGTVFNSNATVYARWTANPVSTGGFSVSGTKLLDSNGKEFVMRGVNHAHTWFKGEMNTALTAIAATGANTVRVVLANGKQWSEDNEASVKQIVDRCKALGMIAVLEIHDATGKNDTQSLNDAVDYWIKIKNVLIGNEAYVIVNIANEWYGEWNSTGWRDGYLQAIPKLRNAGIKNTLMVDCAGWGQYPKSIHDYGKAVFDADTLKNTMFSIHMYEYAGANAQTVRSNIDGVLALNVPVVIGEFGQKHGSSSGQSTPVAYQEILSYCQSKNVGYLGWSWKGNGSPVEYLDIALDWNGARLSSDWGTPLVNHIRTTSVKASVFTNNTAAASSPIQLPTPVSENESDEVFDIFVDKLTLAVIPKKLKLRYVS